MFQQSIVVTRGGTTASTQPFRFDLEKLGGTWNKSRRSWIMPAAATEELRTRQIKLAAEMESAGLAVSIETSEPGDLLPGLAAN